MMVNGKRCLQEGQDACPSALEINVSITVAVKIVLGMGFHS